MIVYIATSNPGKLRDFAAAATQGIALAPLPGLKEIASPPEDEPTFEGNARLKAIYYSQHAPGQIIIADDSGLEVDALQGMPGVRSARYAEDQHFAGPPSSTPDERNNLCLIQAIQSTPEKHRQARYHCVLAAARDSEVLAIGSGEVEGQILLTPRGTGGFGYDPFFYLTEPGKTMAELDLQTRLRFSHRGRAFAALLAPLAAHMP
jgi:XTP/dITP diphosphohydrolase